MSGLSLLLRQALRSFLRTPGFSAAIVGTLALGLGVNAALFSLAYGLLLAPLPYPEPEQLVAVWETVERDTIERREFSYPNFRDLAAGAKSFDSIAAWTGSGLTLTGLDRAQYLEGELVSGAYFDTLGVAPVLGRVFPAEQNTTTAAAPEAVLGHGLWTRLFGADPGVAGRSLTVDGRQVTIIGVMPPGFAGLSEQAELWLPIAAMAEDDLESRADRWLAVIARLADGASPATADEETRSLLSNLAAAHPDASRGYSGRVVELRENLIGGLRQPVLILAGAVGLVLLIACANVANLLLIRATGRRREAAVRAALGASRRDRLRQTLIEALVPALAAGALALLLAGWLLATFRALNPIELPSFATPALGTSTLVFSVLLAVATGVALGLLAAAGREAGSLSDDLRDGGRSGSAGRRGRHTRRALVVVEVACALVVSLGAGLLAKSLRQMADIDPGFDPRGLQVVRLNLPPVAQPGDRRVLADALLERVSHLPGVSAAALGSDMPMDDSWSATLLRPEGQAPRADQPYDGATRVYVHLVSPSYRPALGIRLLDGRWFTAADWNDPQRPLVVSQKLARRLWPGESPVGKRLQQGRSGDSPVFTVVGMVADVRQRTLAPNPLNPEDPDYYRPLNADNRDTLALAVRSSLPPATILPAVRAEIERLSREVPIYDVATMPSRVAGQLATARLNAFLLGLFAALSLVLAGVGIYSVLAHLIGQRRREIGIRLALGAQRSEVVLAVAREGLTWVAAGLVVGFVTALALGRVLASQLYEVEATDPQTLAGVLALFLGLAAAACLLPTRRALRVDPVESLRSE